MTPTAVPDVEKQRNIRIAASWVGQVAQQLGVKTLSQTDYNAHRPADAPSARTLIRYCDTWVAACEAAGLEAGMPSPVKWTDESLIMALQSAAEDTDGPFTAAKYVRWRASQPDPFSWPSIAQFITPGPSRRPKKNRTPWVDWCRRAGVTPAVKRRALKFTDDDLQDVLWACHLARPPEQQTWPLTEAAYIEWASGQTGKLPHHRTFSLRYGTWRAAIEAANLPATPRSNDVLMNTTEAIRAAQSECSSPRSPLSAAAYERWANGHPDRPSLSTIIRDHKTWRAAQEAAGIDHPDFAPPAAARRRRNAQGAVPTPA